jgi:peptidoglycan hydrolase-like protein with peptidoglycan-binding domain
MAAALIVSLLVVGGWAGPADASVSEGYFTGAGSPTDDFNDEGTLSTSSHSKSQAVKLWQEILLANGQLSSSDLDCSFGSKTKAATKNFQLLYGLSDVDGIAGPKTFAAAGRDLTISGNWVTYTSASGTAWSWYRDPSTHRYKDFNTYTFSYTATTCW